MESDQVRELKQLQEENARLKRLVAELSLDKAILQDINSKKMDLLPSIEALLRHAVGPTQLEHRRAQRRLLQDCRDLLDRKPLPLHGKISVLIDPILPQNSPCKWYRKLGARQSLLAVARRPASPAP